MKPLNSSSKRSWTDASESVTNWINWYKAPTPKFTLKSTIDSIEISIESNKVWKQSIVNGKLTYGEQPNPVPIRIFRFPLKHDDIIRHKYGSTTDL